MFEEDCIIVGHLSLQASLPSVVSCLLGVTHCMQRAQSHITQHEMSVLVALKKSQSELFLCGLM